MATNPASSLFEPRDLSLLTPRFVLNTGRTNGSQSFAVDELGRWLYLHQDIGADDTVLSLISRFRLDGPSAQTAESSMNASTSIGHQGLSVQITPNAPQATGATAQLWVTATTIPGACYRAPYVPGGNFVPGGAYQFFSDVPGATGNTNPTVSRDQRLLFVRCRTGSLNRIRGFMLADIVSPGDHSTKRIYEWSFTPPTGPSSGPADTCTGTQSWGVQNMGCDGQFVTIAMGDGLCVSPLFRTYSLDGTPLSEGYLGVRQPRWSISDWGDIPLIPTGTVRSEPEAIVYLPTEADSPIRAHALICSGTDGDRIHRVYQMGTGYELASKANVIASNILANFPTQAGTSHGTYVRETVSSLVREGIWDYLGCLYVFAATAENQCRINWIDPGVATLSMIGTVSFNPKTGVTGSPGACYQSPLNFQNLPNHYRDGMHAAVRVISTLPTGYEVLGAEAGGWTRIYPRNGSDICQTRAMDSAGSDNLSGINNAAGLWVVNRELRGSYSVCRDGVSLATYSVASAKPIASKLQFLHPDCTAKITYGSIGYALPLGLQAKFKTIMDNFVNAVAALP